METGTKKSSLHAHVCFTDNRPAENGPDRIILIPDSINLGICVHLCPSVAKAPFYPRQITYHSQKIRLNPGKSRSKNKTRLENATAPMAHPLGPDSIVLNPDFLTFQIGVHPHPSVVKNSGNRPKRFVIEFPAAKGYGWSCHMEFVE
jgi:hypothetical protein